MSSVHASDTRRPGLFGAFGRRINPLAAGIGLAGLAVIAALLPFRLRAIQDAALATAPVSQLQEAAARPGADARIRYYLGAALVRENRFPEAVQTLTDALASLDKPGDRQLRARVQGSLAEALVEVGDDMSAQRHLKQALEVDAGIVSAHLAFGRVLRRRQLYEPAVVEFTAATMLEPDNAAAWFELGRTHNQGRKPEMGEPPLRKAVKLAPGVSLYWQELGDSLARRSRFTEAEPLFRKAAQLEPANRSAAASVARIGLLQARTLAEYRKARSALAAFADDDSAGAFYHVQLGMLDLQFGDLKNAEARLARAIALEPSNSEALYNLSLVYARAGREAEAAAARRRFKEVVALYQRVVVLKKRLAAAPKDLPLNLELGRALVKQRKYLEAYEQFSYTLRVVPTSLEASQALGELSRRPEVAAVLRPGPGR